ncbi:MAG: hypothetical protein RL410_1439 [Actinomycetota bacterium]|jgi:predicted DNA-binding protein (UPF0251 family)
MSNQLYEFISSVVLDADIALIAAADAQLISGATSATDLQALSIARGEAWRQLRARNVFSDEIPTIAIDGDPVSGLTVEERTVLALIARLNLSVHDAALVMSMKEKAVDGLLKTARRELARTGIAMTLMTNPSKCPVIAQFHSTLNGVMNRGSVMSLVSHSAECSICVPVLRTVDKQIVSQYIAAPRVQVPTEIVPLLQRDTAPLIERATLNAGWAPNERDRNSTFHVKRAIVYGFLSTLLIAIGIVVALQN